MRKLPMPAVRRTSQAKHDAVAELVSDNHVPISPQHKHRLITALTVVGTLGGLLRRVVDRRVDIANSDLLWLAACGIAALRDTRFSSLLAATSPCNAALSEGTDALPPDNNGRLSSWNWLKKSRAVCAANS